MSPVRLFLFSLATLFGSSIALQDGQRLPESWCITYLSTYLVPRSDDHTRPTASSADESVFSGASGATLAFPTDLAIPSTFPVHDDLVITTSVPSPTTGTSVPDASGRSVIFRVVPESLDTKRDLQVRAVIGFVGSQSEICAAATIFNFVQGRLLDGNLPIYYNGEDFKELRGYPGALPRDAVTETFADEAGFLRFFSSVLPNGEAGFCQDAGSGQVYITFTASPPRCQSIRLSITGVDECRDGDISSNPSSRPTSMPLLAESTSALAVTTPPLNSIASPTTKDIQKGSSTIDVPTFTSQVKPVYTSSVRFYNSSSSIEYPVRPAITQISSMLDISTPVTDIPLTSRLSSWTSNAETLLTDALSTDVLGTSQELPSIFDPTTTATSTTMDAQNTIGTSSGTASTASSIVHSSTTSGPSYSFETDTSTLSDLPLDAGSSFDSSSTFTTTIDTTTSTTTSSEATGTRACPEGLSKPLTLFDGQRPSDNGVEWLVLPFLITLYGETSDMLYISPNGLVTLRDSFGADSVSNMALPDENVESLAIFPYWTDMIVPEGSGAEVTYQIEDIPNQPGVLTIDWCVFTTPDGTEPNHFQMVVSEDQLTPITFLYYTIHLGGSYATIGAQNRDSGQFLQYYGPIPDRTFMEVSTFSDGEDLRIGQF
ncbi:uncharacterized protein FFB20_06760 [Fusarium fujikuroi]|uniref:DUF7908 domain-containing protein n=2 Tax=Fusarium fujikuroi TaxID=5127 RepID=S0E5F9_GIBF5|nr:uncharacterized protein FFUJ_07769 [Fusarium fujikuroi IMI 58289]KLO88751.1 uncharacterized protein Y057_11532 [Fusarium fujikuroi]KLP13524.1 uncharacterized protein LW94_3690 [Fusarium fujikuroi]QGI64888.1 hypothetical protein CEK27_008859 [Fusarium fujikuroi]QGI82141.1 hypothetical protein CEK25_008870 [Fusarium fujikuroi]QGI95771.1 hypothetical protein CEK26_008840 [Fusarium fujikuroi]